MCTYFPWHLYDFEHTDTVSAVIYSLSNAFTAIHGLSVLLLQSWEEPS